LSSTVSLSMAGSYGQSSLLGREQLAMWTLLTFRVDPLLLGEESGQRKFSKKPVWNSRWLMQQNELAAPKNFSEHKWILRLMWIVRAETVYDRETFPFLNSPPPRPFTSFYGTDVTDARAIVQSDDDCDMVIQQSFTFAWTTPFDFFNLFQYLFLHLDWSRMFCNNSTIISVSLSTVPLFRHPNSCTDVL
jgi:hypothetical protein